MATTAAAEHHVEALDLAGLTKMYDFTGKSVAITGGAGILGSEIAGALAGCGAPRESSTVIVTVDCAQRVAGDSNIPVSATAPNLALHLNHGKIQQIGGGEPEVDDRDTL